jgi:hypothetical protein
MLPFAGNAAYFCVAVKIISPLDPEYNPLFSKYYFTAISFPNNWYASWNGSSRLCVSDL